MIPIDRGTDPEPETLSAARTRLLGELGHGPPPAGYEFRHYDFGKARLYEQQHRKCAYCEVHESGFKYRDLEHFRPKSTYWWLAWTWSNHLFACKECNSDHKRDQFPLVDEARRLVALHQPPGEEVAYLIDPALEDGRRFIEYVFNHPNLPNNWSAQPRNGDERGSKTIEICGLNRPMLLAHYGRHVREEVEPALDQFAADGAGSLTLGDAWGKLHKRLLEPWRALVGLSMDVIEQRIGQQLAKAGIQLRP